MHLNPHVLRFTAVIEGSPYLIGNLLTREEVVGLEALSTFQFLEEGGKEKWREGSREKRREG